MGQKYDVVGVILAPAAAMSGGGFCSTIFGLAVLTGIGFVCYAMVTFYLVLMSLMQRLATSLGQYAPVVFASVLFCGGMSLLGVLAVLILYLFLTTKKK